MIVYTSKKVLFHLVASLSLIACSINVEAKPWLDAGDMQLRHQLQILSDAGVLSAP